MASETPQPKPSEPAQINVHNGAAWWQIAAVLVAFVGGQGVTEWWNKPATVPAVQPVVVAPVKPAEIDESRAYVTRDGVTLADDQAKAIIAAVKIGDGAYSLVSYPVGSAPVVKQLTIGQSKPSVPVVVPDKPVTPDKPVEPTPVTTKPTAAFYVYEKDDTAVPNYVKTGLSKINASGVEGSLLEDDTKDGNNQVPARFQVPLNEAKKAGLPVLVVMSGGQFLRAVKPKSEAEMLEAVK